MMLRKSPTYLYIVLFIALFLSEPDYQSSINAKQLLLYSSLFLLSIAIHFFSLRKEKNWFRLDVLFILGFGIVHFQWPIMVAFSEIYPERMLRAWSDSAYMNYGTWLSTLGAIAWLYGYSLISLKTKTSSKKYNYDYIPVFWFTLMVYTMFLLTAGNAYLTGKIYKGYGYGRIGETLGAYFSLLTLISMLVLTTFVIINKRINYKSNVMQWFIGSDKKYLIMAGSYVFLHLAIGDRGGAIFLTFAFLVLFGQFVRPIKFKEFILIAICGAIILTLIGLGRSSDSGDAREACCT